MSAPGNRTLDRIQQEIQEGIDREKELRTKQHHLNNNTESDSEMVEPPPQRNGFAPKAVARVAFQAVRSRSVPAPQPPRRLFAPHHARGLMQKFYQMRGKVSGAAVRPAAQPQAWTRDSAAPPRVAREAGRDLRNGFVPAREKMERELREFRAREAELRKERRQSQPDLMAALEEAGRLGNGFSAGSEEDWESQSSQSSQVNGVANGGATLKRSQSLAALCDLSDEELDVPGTHSLIMQFESLNRA